MSERKDKYLTNLYNKVDTLLYRFMDSDAVEWSNKQQVLVNLKDMIDDKIHELHSEDMYG